MSAPWVRLLPRLLAPVGALLIAAAISSIALLISNQDPATAFSSMIEYGTRPESLVSILNRSIDLYIGGVAVAIGFRMNLFNIGVDGQYRLASLAAASLGAAPFLQWLPGVLRILVIVLIAMVVGAFWAGVAALLKVTRGVSEVISTIMLNFIGGQLVAYLLTTNHLGVQAKGSNDVATPLLPKDSWISGIPLIPDARSEVNGFIVVAVGVGVAYWFVLGRTRFGFDLRASGQNATSAVASGVNARRMVLYAMLLSGAVAGLVGMSQLLGERHAHTTSVGGLGFTAIGIALLGRNSPVGIALAALLWAFLDRSALILDLNEIPKEIVTIMQGTTVLAVVVAYELAERISRRGQQRRAGATVSEPDPRQPSEVPA
ncbi:ABC transporter permease [Planosporangium flavigriseum]|uniref:ABC transporter permease n=1 Tax=Planosporangium flavigriseum TaxID=373681 RepID=A0A8J3LQN0_9ACTN|nr:ABC transporter permease [Planosporangium flavigriseum]NJC63507.1 ABC transporter permease [Planosporangium flavigriseum]GIG72204.1 ABC transporter permease [Planosporangium flavigriseum]